MEPLTERLLNDFQHDFPLSPAPFAQIARRLNTSTTVVLARLRELQRQGAVSRVGPVFRPNTIGASTLAAMQVPAGELEAVAAVVNGFPEVNHNYEREHRYNLWFVVTAANQAMPCSPCRWCGIITSISDSACHCRVMPRCLMTA